jgi:hypothetical protein
MVAPSAICSTQRPRNPVAAIALGLAGLGVICCADMERAPQPDTSAKPTLTLQTGGPPGSLVLAVSNATPRLLKLWKPANSWGDESFGFEFRRTDGSALGRLKRKPQDWTRNFPSCFALQPGQSHELRFRLDDGWWEVPAPVTAARQGPLELRALLTIRPSAEAAQHGVFTGAVASAWVKSLPPHAWLP